MYIAEINENGIIEGIWKGTKKQISKEFGEYNGTSGIADDAYVYATSIVKGLANIIRESNGDYSESWLRNHAQQLV